MAKSKKMSRARRAQKGAQTPQTLGVRVLLETADTPAYFINYAEVNISLHEFALSVGRVPTRLEGAKAKTAQDSGTLAVPADVQLLFPPTLVKGLIKAITQVKDAYEAQFGEIREQS